MSKTHAVTPMVVSAASAVADFTMEAVAAAAEAAEAAAAAEGVARRACAALLGASALSSPKHVATAHPTHAGAESAARPRRRSGGVAWGTSNHCAMVRILCIEILECFLVFVLFLLSGRHTEDPAQLV